MSPLLWKVLRRLLIALPFASGLGVLVVDRHEVYRKKSLQSEAKTNLAGLFTAEKAFFGEYMTYSTDLVSVNWSPDGEPLYVYGFCNAFPPERIAGISSYDGMRNASSKDGVAGDPERYSRRNTRSLGDPCAALATLGLDSAFHVNGWSFVAFAVGNIDEDPELDVWSIDNNKTLTLIARD